MNIPEIILTEVDYRAALARAKAIFHAKSGEPELEEVDALAALIEAYEAVCYPIFL